MSTVETATEIKSFSVEVPDEQLDDLRLRIGAARLPSKELVDDRSQGVQLAMIRELAHYWATDYDWRKAEVKLNALPQCTTEIDGVDVHFIHVRSQHEDALPLIMTHGWPGSVMEFLETVGRSPIPLRTAARPRTRSISCCRPFRATASPGSRKSSGGSRAGPLAPGAS
jgi:Epoxide hydrolase N terminus